MDDTSASSTVLDALRRSADVGDCGFTFADGRSEQHVPFGHLAQAVSTRAGGLQALGLAPGDRVALILPDQQAFVVAFLAALAAGLVPVPMYPPFSLARVENWRRATEGILRVASPAAIVTVDEVCPLLWSTASRVDAKVLTWRQLTTAPRAPFTPVAVGPDDLAFLQFTSGSTTHPRGVMVSHRNIIDNCRRITGGFLRDVDITGVSWLPLYHDMGLIGCVLAPLLAGAPMVFLDTAAFIKRPALWFDLIDRHRATATFAPHFAYALAVRRINETQVAGWDLSCLRVAGCGAEPIAATTLRAFTAHFAAAGLRPEALCPSYGLAEATLMATYTPVEQLWRSQVVDADRLVHHGQARPPAATPAGGVKTVELVGCGVPLPDHQVRIVDEHGQPLPDGRVGQIELAGPSITDGYFADPRATADTYVAGRLRTGDLGYLSDGQLYVTGRHRDLVIVHGRNYAPQTIEWALDGLPGVRAGAVVAFAYPDAQGVEQLGIACEATTTDAAAVDHAVRTRISQELALTVAQVVVLRPGTLPKTSSGKVQRSRTRAMVLDGSLQRSARGTPTARRSRLRLAWRLRRQAATGWIRYRLHQLTHTRRGGGAGRRR